VTLPAIIRKFAGNKTGCMLVVALAIYLALYICLSLQGSFSATLVVSGKHRYSGSGMGMPDSQVWNPCFVVCLPYQKNVLGFLYFPLIQLDRAFFHKTINIDSAFPLDGNHAVTK
jgi:hypothetical protein